MTGVGITRCDRRNSSYSGSVLLRAVDRALHGYWKSKLLLTPRRLYARLAGITVDRPIFLLGTQGCGGTIVSRFIRWHPDVVYITGNRRFWGGEDEMHNKVRFKKLPDTWVLRSPGYNNLLGREEYHPVFAHERSWLYATDQLLPEYRKTEEDYDTKEEGVFLGAIRKCIRAYSEEMSRARYHDMSQSYCLKVRLLRRVLPDARFIVLLRNPYAMCWREVTRSTAKYCNYALVPSIGENLELACQHWRNSYAIALEDLSDTEAGLVMRFEDFINDPASSMGRILQHCELDPARYTLPAGGNKPPLGTVSRDKWLPLSTDVNGKYLAELPRWAEATIASRCKRLIERFDYNAHVGESAGCLEE